MKNILILLLIGLGFVQFNAQVSIERPNKDVRGDGIMDFPESATKGILLPRVENTTETPVAGGALAFNLTTQQVEVFNPLIGWQAMTENSETDIIALSNFDELNPANGVIISNEENTEDVPVGVLVFESTNKALILPQLVDVTLMPSPEAGMIAYDISTQSMDIFNGSVWSFWN